MEKALKLKQAILTLGLKNAITTARGLAEREQISWDSGLKYIFTVIAKNPDRAPNNIGTSKDCENGAIKKWLLKYQNGYAGRASQRKSNLPGTVADPIIEKIIGFRLRGLLENNLKKITFAHRLGMSAENILGLILEEYLSEQLIDYGWHCAWGETVKSVDFVNQDGNLLQVKNRSNSENSSSSSVRDGTSIQKWFRIKSNKIEYMWPELNKICRTSHLSEESFVHFAKKVLISNPDCLAIEPSNPWKEINN